MDRLPAEGTPEAAQLETLAREVEASADRLATTLRSTGRAHLGELIERAGPKPPLRDVLRDAERFSFWVANILPLDGARKLQMLGCESTVERLEMQRETLTSNDARNCVVQ